MKEVMPDKYLEEPEEELASRIKRIKADLGRDLLVLTHHYQRQEIVDLGDKSGDSFKLSKDAAEDETARYIVFCGVHFMAESAAILARLDQAVFSPALEAGCPMADMAPIAEVERAWKELAETVEVNEVAPITYVNSTGAVKAFCGARGGATCTSSNAEKIFSWALKEKSKIFFMPDEHLGTNSASKLGLGPAAVWDPALPGGGLAAEKVREASVIVWKGYCHVHTNFTAEMIGKKRNELPGCKVIVHPECPKPVVDAADASGSTEGIINYVAGLPSGSTAVVGTEVHLVDRLTRLYEGDKKVVPLARSMCPNMYKINLRNMAWVMDSLAAGPDNRVNRVTVTDEVKENAALALRRMLEVAG